VDLVRGLAAKGVKCLVVLPKDGPIHPALVEYGCTVFFVPDSLYGVWLWTGPAQTQPFPPALVKQVLIDIQNSIIPQLKLFSDIKVVYNFILQQKYLCRISIKVVYKHSNLILSLQIH